MNRYANVMNPFFVHAVNVMNPPRDYGKNHDIGKSTNKIRRVTIVRRGTFSNNAGALRHFKATRPAIFLLETERKEFLKEEAEFLLS